MSEQNTIALEDLYFFAERIADSHALSPEIKDLLLEQVEKLGEIYGAHIDRKEALRILSRQIEITKTGYITEPVDIVEFIESPEYMNQGAYVRPAILDHLVALFTTDRYYYEVVAGGAIGAGKNYFADMAQSYVLYHLSCLYSPQAYYGLAPGSAIIFVHQSRTLSSAKHVAYKEFASRIASSPYFQTEFPPDPRFRAELRFPYNITVLPVSGTETAALGMNVFGGIIDEMNFMVRVKGSKLIQHTDEAEYDQAEKLYLTMLRRIESRFYRGNKVPGKIFLISSANYEGDFIDRKEKESKTNPHIYVMHMSHWEAVRGHTEFSGEKFYIRLPTRKAAGEILSRRPDNLKGHLEVPVEYRERFERDLPAALRDIAGIAIERRNRFIDGKYVDSCFSSYTPVYGEEQIFSRPVASIGASALKTNVGLLEALVNVPFLKRIAHLGPYACHIDLGVSGDAAGVSIGHVIGSKDVGFRTVADPTTGQFRREAKGDMPIYGVPGILKLLPPSGDEIDLNLIRELILMVSDFIGINWITSDRFQSTSMLQFFRSNGIITDILSLDRTPNAYIETKLAMREQRVFLFPHTDLMDEFISLEQDFSTGLVDHPSGGAKDLSDSVAGVVFSLSQKRASYRKKGTPLSVKGKIRTTSSYGGRPSITNRPKSGRMSIY